MDASRPASVASAAPLAPRRSGGAEPGSASGDGGTNVRVCCRFRPASEQEQEDGAARCVELGPEGRSLTLSACDERGAFHTTGLSGVSADFTFDRVFSEDASQQQVYEFSAKPLVRDVLDGYNCTIFAYGQTGSGKTHTMMGPAVGDGDANPAAPQEQAAGIIPRIAQDVFVAMAEADADAEFMVKVSFVEIYMERIQDLLNVGRENVRIREDRAGGVALEGVEEVYVSSARELLKVVARGDLCRAIATTRMNKVSSRSHSVLMLSVHQRRATGSRVGKLFLVDLAGSEMAKKTGAAGKTLQEAKTINRSLSALGNVIKALVDGSAHVPYRDSKLTRCLQDSLGGNSKTSLIITCSGFSANAAETLSTLRFGTRAKRIRNKPKVNREMTVAECKALLAAATGSLKCVWDYTRVLEGKLGVGADSSPLRCDANGHVNLSQDLLARLAAGAPPAGAVLRSSSSSGSSHHSGDSCSSSSLSEAAEAATAQARRRRHRPSSSTGELELFSHATAATAATAASGARSDPGLLARAEEALTVALEKVDSLRRRLQDKQDDVAVSRQALDGARARALQLEEDLAASSQERAALVQRVASLELFREEARFAAKEMSLTIDGLRAENRVMAEAQQRSRRTSLTAGAMPRDLCSTADEAECKSTELVGAAPSDAAPVDAAQETRAVAVQPSDATKQPSDAAKQAPAAMASCSERGGGGWGRASSAEASLLTSDLQVITDKYIQLRFEHLEMQEALSASEHNDLRQILDSLATERQRAAQLEQELRATRGDAELAEHRDLTWRLKLKNREDQIQFLEEAVQDYQDTFKSHVERYQKQLGDTQRELSRYKRALDALDGDDSSASDETASLEPPSPEGKRSSAAGDAKLFRPAPRVIKPVRGRRSGAGQDDDGASAAAWHMRELGKLPAARPPTSDDESELVEVGRTVARAPGTSIRIDQ